MAKVKPGMRPLKNGTDIMAYSYPDNSTFVASLTKDSGDTKNKKGLLFMVGSVVGLVLCFFIFSQMPRNPEMSGGAILMLLVTCTFGTGWLASRLATGAKARPQVVITPDMISVHGERFDRAHASHFQARVHSKFKGDRESIINTANSGQGGWKMATPQDHWVVFFMYGEEEIHLNYAMLEEQALTTVRKFNKELDRLAPEGQTVVSHVTHGGQSSDRKPAEAISF